jgi:hypothetical protein
MIALFAAMGQGRVECQAWGYTHLRCGPVFDAGFGIGASASAGADGAGGNQ